MGVWGFDSHAPGRPDFPSPALHATHPVPPIPISPHHDANEEHIPISIICLVALWWRGLTALLSQCVSLRKRKEKLRTTLVGSGNSPDINKGKGDTLARKSRESPPPHSCEVRNADGDLEGYRKHPAP
eukprot:1160563-Pelagomonas_calceolata.AAC.1